MSLSTGAPPGWPPRPWPLPARRRPAETWPSWPRFLSDTILLTGEGFAAAGGAPRPYGRHRGRHGERDRQQGLADGGDRVLPLATAVGGNTPPRSRTRLADAVEARGANAGGPVVLRLACAPRRTSSTTCSAGVDAGSRPRCSRRAGRWPRTRPAGGDDDGLGRGRAARSWTSTVLQASVPDHIRATWAASSAAMTPMDAAMQVAVPEFDGRLITVPFSFKEAGPDGIPVYAADPEAGRAGWPGSRWHTPGCATSRAASKRLAIMLSSYPTKHARIGNAVGLDTPASAVVLLQALREAGYDRGRRVPRRRRHPDAPADRGGRAGHRVAHRRPARGRDPPRAAGRVRTVVRGTPRPAAGRRPGALGPAARRAVHRPRRHRAGRPCGSGTWS